MGDFLVHSIGAGLNEAALGHLSVEDKRTVLLLLARVSEQSYRRGFQQGCYMHEHGRVVVDPARWRTDAPVDDSPDPDSKAGRFVSVQERLDENYGVMLTRLGLWSVA